MTSLNVAKAKSRFSELLGRVARDGETILITRRGKPMAKLVPVGDDETPHLADVRGWLDDDDPFFDAIDSIVESRARHAPRILAESNPFDEE